MMRKSPLIALYSFFLLSILVIPVRAEDPKPLADEKKTESEEQQIARIAQRLDEMGPGLINQISFTMLHAGGDFDLFMKAVGSPDEHGKNFKFASAVKEAGGLAKYRRRVAELLTNENELVRGYGAQWLGMVGDDSCKEDLLKLLKTKPANEEHDVISGFDREMAAGALGTLGAKECAKDLAAMLQDKNARVRAGAACALGMLKAKEFTDDIVKSLDYEGEFDPRSEEAYQGAIFALVELDAKQHAPAIAKLLKKHDVAEFAMFALVALDAKEQAKDIAALLDDDFRGGDAALALALMGAKEQADSIGKLMKKKNDFGFSRCKAAIALGILREDKFASDIADLMKSSKDYEQTTAAWAFLLLENKEKAAEALSIIGTDGERSFYSSWVPERGAIIVAKQLDEVGERAFKTYHKLQEEGKKEKTMEAPKKNGEKPANEKPAAQNETH